MGNGENRIEEVYNNLMDECDKCKKEGWGRMCPCQVADILESIEKLKQENQEVNNLAEEKARHEKETKDLSVENESLTQQLAEAKEENEGLNRKYNDSFEDNMARIKVITEYQDECRSLNSEVDRGLKTISALNNTIEELQRTINNLAKEDK
jgi:chromosome segregation ATPase